MSDTPETDAAVIAAGGDWSPGLRAVAQRLERERNSARELAQAFHNDQVTLLLERDEAREVLRTLAEHGENEIQRLIKECDEAREQANVMHEQWLSKGRCCENLAEELHEVKQQRDDYKWQLHIAKGEVAEARKMERAWKKEETK